MVGRRPQLPPPQVIVAGVLRLLRPAAVAPLNHSAVLSVLASSSPSRCLKVAFKGILCSPSKKGFSK